MVYDSSGKLVAEYNATPVNNGTQYVFGDYQASPRTITNNQGESVSRHDYLPFGEELGAVGMRDSVAGMGERTVCDRSMRAWRLKSSPAILIAGLLAAGAPV